MLYIVYKDLYQSRKTIALYFTIGLVFILYSFLNNLGLAMSAAFTFVMVYGVVIRTEYNEDKNKGYTLLRILPIKPYKIVISKYITPLLLATAGILFYVIIAKLSGGRMTIDNVAISIILAGSGFTLAFTGAVYVLIYRYGAAKAINISRIIFFALMFLPGLISSLLVKYIPKPSFIQSGKLENLLERLSNNPVNFNLLIIGLALAIYLLTMLISIRQFNNKRIM